MFKGTSSRRGRANRSARAVNGSRSPAGRTQPLRRSAVSTTSTIRTTALVRKENNLEIVDIAPRPTELLRTPPSLRRRRLSADREYFTPVVVPKSPTGDAISVAEQIENLKKPGDAVHFPKPNPTNVEVFQDLLLLIAECYETVTSISSEVDPCVSRLLAYLSSVCFDVDVCLRYTLLLHNDAKPDNSLLKSKLKVMALGSFGLAADKLLMSAADLITRTKSYESKLFDFCNYEAHIPGVHSTADKFQQLADAFATLGELSAIFSNKMYLAGRLFSIRTERISLSLEEGPTAPADIRLFKKNFMDFTRQFECRMNTTMSMFQVLKTLWKKSIHESCVEDKMSLALNELEAPLLAFERLKVSFFAPYVKDFVKLHFKRLVLKDGTADLYRICRVLSLHPSSITSPVKIERKVERKVFTRWAVDEININVEILNNSIKRESEFKEMRAEENLKGGRIRRRRAFARKIRGMKKF